MVLALPMNNVGLGTTVFSDLSADIKGSGAAKTITRNGNPGISTVQSIFYGSSAFFDGTNDYLETPHNADFTLLRSASCMECWVYPTSLSVQRIVFDKSNSGGSNQSYGLRINTNGTVLMEWIYPGGSAASLTSAGTVQTNTWSHIAVVASGNTLYIYINGVRDANSAALSNDAQSTTSTPFRVGSTYTTSNRFLGYIQDVRVYNNLAKYTTNFYPSKPAGGLPIHNTTDDFGVVKGTGTRTDSFSSSLVLALPMNGAGAGTTFTDESANIKGSGSAKTITVSSTTTSTTQSKFYGSSGSFNGSSSHLRLDSSADFDFGSGNFTVESWVYLNSMPTTDSWPGSYASWMEIVGYGSASLGDGWQFRIGQTVLAFGTNGDTTAVSATHGITINRWFHLAVTRNGNEYTLWVNGNRIGSATYTANNPGTGAFLWVGTETNQGAYLNGFIQDLRIYKGVAKYNSNFTPPIRTDWTPNNLSVAATIPVSSATGALPILNTSDDLAQTLSSGIRSDSLASSLHLCMPLTTAGSRSLADDVSPTGRTIATKTVTLNNVTNSSSGSLFYGNSFSNTATNPSYLGLPDRVIDYSSSFTIECWIYRPSGIGAGIYSDGNGPSGGGLLWLSFSVGSNGVLATYSYPSGTGGGGSLAVPANTWTHIAFVNNSGTINYYVNGVKDGTSHAWAVPGGSTGQYQALYTINSGVKHQDLRMYRTAKYTATFIPPKPTLTLSEQSSADSFVDTPTNYGTDSGLGSEVRGNYATLNPLNQSGSNTLSNGNLDAVVAAGSTPVVVGTIGVSSGKWYWEVVATAMTGTSAMIGVANLGAAAGSRGYATTNGWYYYAFDGTKYTNNAGASYGSTYAVNDVIGVALDMDAGTLTFYKNGVSQGVAYNTGLSGKTLAPALNNGTAGGTQTYTCNFGQRAFAYQAPSGFKSLNTANLPTPTITKPSSVFDVKLYTGNAGINTVTGLGFSPDFVWIKDRGNAYNHRVFDTLRPLNAKLQTNVTDAEVSTTENDNFVSFNNTGFTLGATSSTNGSNASSASLVAWAWDAGSSTVTDNTGTIQSSRRTNASAGISIVTYTGTGTTGTVGHGLGVVPSMMIVKRRDAVANWYVYHSAIGNTGALGLNLTNATITSANFWNNTSPTSTVLTVSAGSAEMNTNGGTYVVYCFAPVNSFSAFGSYTGNGSTDGPMVVLGFRPRCLWIKETSGIGNWLVWDTARETFNVMNDCLVPNLSSTGFIDNTSLDLDVTANGFKIRSTSDDYNGNTATFIYCAWAESPFQYSRAR